MKSGKTIVLVLINAAITIGGMIIGSKLQESIIQDAISERLLEKKEENEEEE